MFPAKVLNFKNMRIVLSSGEIMARLLLSNKENGDYEFSFEPITEESVGKAVIKFLTRYGFARRIRINPCDYRIRALSLAVLDKDKRIEFKVECCDKQGLEHKEFIVDKEVLAKKIIELLGKVQEKYRECAKKYSEKLLI